MAPFMVDDDFVGTLSDRDEISDEDTTVTIAQTSALAKRKRHATKEAAVKKSKLDGADSDEDVDSEFEFALEDGTVELDDYEALLGDGDFGAKQGFDVEGAVRRRGYNVLLREELEDDANVSEHADSEEDGDRGDGDEDSVDGFGAGAEMEEENEVDVKDDESEDSRGVGDEDAASNDEDEDSVPTTARGDDANREPMLEQDDDAIEEEKRNAFFAPETKALNGESGASFYSLSLSRPILKGLAEIGFSSPTPIQAKTIPVALAGKDVVGGAVTGSGKTAAFMIPILERLMYRPKRTATTRVAILMPTRELALQCFNVAKKLAVFTDITFGQAIGGLNSREQEKQLKQRPDIVIATPGRFIDLERNTTALAVSTVEILVLDEADRMLEEGFSDELNEILAKIPKSRQTMLFSATMTSKVDDLIRVGLQRPVRLLVDAQRSTVSGLVQEFVRLRPGREAKRLGYLLELCSNVHTNRVIVFFRQKKEAHRVRILFVLCGLKATELHGSMTQEQRIQAIESFRSGKASFLLATDLASRGLDIKGIETVINYEAPQSYEIYLHRVGRTARAGRTGRACTLAAEPDRKVVKAAVKAGKAQGAQIRQRTVEPHTVDAWMTKIDALEPEVDSILQEEKEEKALANTERDLTRVDNFVTHKEEIMSRPRKTWFESEKEKERAKQKGAVELNGPDAAAGKKKKGKLSNKQKKQLTDRDERRDGKMWKKTKSDRTGAKKPVAKKQKGKK